MLSISVVIAATPFPEPGLLTRSFESRTDFVQRFLPLPLVGFVLKSGLFCDLENANFIHLEIPRTREGRAPVQSGVVGVSVAKGSETAGVCVTVTENTNVPSSQSRPLARSEKVRDEQVNKFLWGIESSVVKTMREGTSPKRPDLIILLSRALASSVKVCIWFRPGIAHLANPALLSTIAASSLWSRHRRRATRSSVLTTTNSIADRRLAPGSVLAWKGCGGLTVERSYFFISSSFLSFSSSVRARHPHRRIWLSVSLLFDG
jgi:hypothetical protein